MKEPPAADTYKGEGFDMTGKPTKSSLLPSPDISDSLSALATSRLSTSLASESQKTVKLALSGNLLITALKFAAYGSSGSLAMWSEAIHSLVDSGNQALLLIGLRDVGKLGDKKHAYGYGKSVYFWSLVSALGTFWLGAGVSMSHSVGSLIKGEGLVEVVPMEVWGVLGVSFLVDGVVFSRALGTIMRDKPPGTSPFQHIMNIKDPTTMAVVLEDGAACAGVIIASVGISLSHVLLSPIYDGAAGLGVSLLLAGMGATLVRLNQRFLLGQSVDEDILEGVKGILLRRRSIDNVASVQSQWTGPYSFSYKVSIILFCERKFNECRVPSLRYVILTSVLRGSHLTSPPLTPQHNTTPKRCRTLVNTLPQAEVDFDGTYLAAKLQNRYMSEFASAKSDPEQIKVLLSFYAEDVMRAVEGEIREIENEIRSVYPAAAYIELEPDSRDYNSFAIDESNATDKNREIIALERLLRQMNISNNTRFENEIKNEKDVTKKEK